MGIFNKTQQSMATTSQLAILAEGCTLSGELCVSGNILVAGQVTGEISCQNSVSVGVTGVVRGVVRSRELVVSGLMEGEVYADTLEILAGGRVQGKIQVEQLVVERGGFFAGASEAAVPPSVPPSAPPEHSFLGPRQPVLLEQQ